MIDIVEELRCDGGWCRSHGEWKGLSVRAANEIERLRLQVCRLHDATIILRNGMGGHYHWDGTQQYGDGCEVCKLQQMAIKEAGDLISKGGDE